MYNGNDPNLIDPQTQINDLTARQNSVDGVGLANPADGVLNQHDKRILGIKTDLSQSVLKIESILNTFKKTLNDWVAAFQNHVGIGG